MIWLVAWRISRWLPATALTALIDRLTPVALRRGVIPSEHLRRNLTAVLGELPADELNELVVRNVRSYGRYWREVFQLSRPRGRRLLQQVVVTEPQVLRDAVARGHGVVLALPHMANWDLAGAWTAQYYRVTTVAEQVSPAKLYERFCAMREKLGMRVIPLGAGMETLSLLRQALEANGLVALVADRVVSGTAGVSVSFAGQHALVPAGPATLAFQTGAALIPVGLHYEGARMCITFLPEVAIDSEQPRRDEVGRATQELANAFASVIREHPQDWRALQPVVTNDASSPEPSRQEAM